MEIKKIVYVASECEPFFSTGNLGAVVGSLSSRIARIGKEEYEIVVILPLYSHIGREYRNKLIYVSQMIVELSWRKQYCGIYKYEKNGVTYYFLDNEYYFKRHNLYGYFDDAERFAFLCKAALDVILYLNMRPNIIHVHDHITGLLPVYARTLYQDYEDIKQSKIVFTIHSVDYQGVYSLDDDIVSDVFGLPLASKELLEYNGNLNIMKAAMETADFVTTVSESFAKEILNPPYANGLEYEARRVKNANKLMGILNGIDKVYYNPLKDKALFAKYDKKDITNKVVNKVELQKMLNLTVDERIPLIGMVGELTDEKGLRDVQKILDHLLHENIEMVILGVENSYYEELLMHYSANNRAKFRSVIAYNEDLARKIFAAADLYLVPSYNEPCGLNHMLASRYGAVPVVRSVGGLKDSIVDFKKNNGNGYVYSGDEQTLLATIKRALNDYKNPEIWQEYQYRVMNVDFGWTSSTKEYLKLYKKLTKNILKVDKGVQNVDK